jgi:hypothetical protein
LIADIAKWFREKVTAEKKGHGSASAFGTKDTRQNIR